MSTKGSFCRVCPAGRVLAVFSPRFATLPQASTSYTRLTSITSPSAPPSKRISSFPSSPHFGHLLAFNNEPPLRAREVIPAADTRKKEKELLRAAHQDEVRHAGRLLLTTRNSQIATDFGAIEWRREFANQRGSHHFLCSKVRLRRSPSLPILAKEVAKECGNVPLALAIAGARVLGDPQSWRKGSTAAKVG
jgi:hypothetical protein